MNLTTSSGLSLSVENLSFQTVNRFSGHAICDGFDLLTVNGLVSLSFEEFNELVPATLFVEIVNVLDATAQKMADDDLAERMEARAAYRVACHG